MEIQDDENYDYGKILSIELSDTSDGSRMTGRFVTKGDQ